MDRTLASRPSGPARLPQLDLARGAAILAMIVYHAAYNLSFLGLIDADIRDMPGWIWFARAIAGSFLFITGISLGLAHGQGFRRDAFLRRLAIVAGAALLITLSTYLAFPERYVRFGILHAIAASSLLALPFLRLPVAVILAAAAIILVLPAFVSLDALSAPALAWLGLGTRAPASMDFVPLFPWLGCVLAGLALAKAVQLRPLLAGEPGIAPLKLLAGAGRRSLIIYLVHQPILYGALLLVALAVEPRSDPAAHGFLAACQSQCRATGGEAARCGALCRCAVAGLKAEGLWQAVLADTLDPSQRLRLEAISRRCAAPP